MKTSRERGGFLLGVFTTAALVVLVILLQAAMRPADAMPPHGHTQSCHGPDKGHEAKEVR